ncbi:extracellular solute-binding protein [Bacillus sp. FJAT-42376]|uniref:extracellular solute-binding protein n=1 Tax=Bacillus sp. FJAT-42376 TaxID=2014076 RepID=UPI000F503DA6|nr:extracellular solute-binding protein [Bacillus sp. FJAT-42376]AZB43757.1 extracellular solute-binding protein [Bacillus sp. FJAT-42376]
MQLRRENDFERKYNQFMNELKDEIVSTRIRKGEYLLPEHQLSHKYEISRVSIRKGLAQLVEEGFIEKIPGKGNRVTLDSAANITTVTLAWYSTSYEVESVEKILNEFERTHPHIKVHLKIMPETEYVPQLIDLIEMGAGPDAFIVSDSQFREFAERGRVHLMDPYQSPRMTEKNSYRQIFEMFSHNGSVYATPFLFSPVVICYNQTLFKDAGMPGLQKMESWEDLLQAALKTTKTGADKTLVEHYGFCFSSSFHRWPVFVLQNGGKLMTSNRSRFTLADEANIEALQYCVDLMYKHRVSPIFTHGSNQLAEDIFNKEKVAMILTTYYYLNEFRNQDIQWDILPLPKKERKATLLLGGGIAVNANSEAKGASQALADFMAGEKAQTILKENGCTIPALKKVAEDDTLLNPDIHPKNYNAFKEVLPYAIPVSELNLHTQEMEILQNELNLVWASMESPKDACERIEKLLNSQLAGCDS